MTDGVLLIVWHSRTGASEAAARAAAAAAGSRARLVRCDDAQEDDFLTAECCLFCCPENLAALSGAMKEMFDRLYYPLLGRIEGRPYASIIVAGSDGSGAQRQLDRIATGWRLRRVAEPMRVMTEAQAPQEILAIKTLSNDDIKRAWEMGATLSEGISLGVF